MGTATRKAHPRPHRRFAVYAALVRARQLQLCDERYGSGHKSSKHSLAHRPDGLPRVRWF
jgi:hypothetical protein